MAATLVLLAAAPLAAQTSSPVSAPAPQCEVVQVAAAPTDAARRTARDLASRAQRASILADSAQALALYARAASLDPTDASIAYSLGRSYEAATDKRALAEYCRFLALTPSAPEASDVRQRLASLAPPVAAAQIALPPSHPESPAAAFALSLLFPGLGQYTTHQAALGLLFTAATAGAVYYGMQSKSEMVSVTRTASDPFGNPYQYQTTEPRTTHPNAATGLGAAAGIVLVSAIQAYSHARADSRIASIAARSSLFVSRDEIGLGVSLPARFAGL